MARRKISFSVPKDVCRDLVADRFCPCEAKGSCCNIHDGDLLGECKGKKEAALRSRKRPAEIAPEAAVSVIVETVSGTTPTTAVSTASPHESSNITVTPQKTTSNLQPALLPAAQDASATEIVSMPPALALQATARASTSKATSQVGNLNLSNDIPNGSIEGRTAKSRATTIPVSKAAITAASTPSKRGFLSRQCKYYINGENCPFKNRQSGCFDIHDLEARQANLATAIKTEKQQSGAKVLTHKSTNAAHANRSSALGTSDSTSKLIQMIKDLTNTKVPTAACYNTMEVTLRSSCGVSNEPLAGTSLVSVAKKQWDPPTNRERWAGSNLGGRTASKSIAPFLPALGNGIAPTQRIFGLGLDVAAAAPAATTTFHMFRWLPFELRDQIWKYAVADEKCDCRITYQFEIDQANRHTENKFVPMNATPRFLHVNREARALALTVYEKAFGTGEHPPNSWFNFEMDRLFLNTRHSTEYLEIAKHMTFKDRKRIHFLAIPLRDLIRGDEKKIMEVIALAFKNVLVIELLAGDGEEDSQWTRNATLQAKIKIWNKRLWLRVQKRRKIPPPIEFTFIPAHTAHFYGIDDFKW